MSLRTKASSWLRTAIFGRQLEREMEQEWRFHLDSRWARAQARSWR